MRIRRWYGAVASVVALATAGVGTARIAYGNDDRNDDERERRGDVVVLREWLTDDQQEPLALSTTGRFALGAGERDRELTYRFSYERLQGEGTQAYLRFVGWRRSSGISALLCTDAGNGPAGPSRVRWHRH
ncbi:hypothetical protein ACN28C_20895 [Plantactinospora sp. WMMC1484]|uniref:hypothetical protein n=1 Tax=Plantactinospora sp. WMMC1484 TaxID=3404122 RepID=UPI003BF48FC1